MVCILASTGCKTKSQDDTCGASVRIVRVDGEKVTLEIANISDETIRIGGSSAASFVDKSGVAMRPQMMPGDDHWFLSFSLPAGSRQQVFVSLKGGEPAQLDRIEIPGSGPSTVPRCTVRISGLAH